MKTETSRKNHQPKKRYSGVYQQQGRMLSDADWNELVDVFKTQLDDALKDIVGTVDNNSESSQGGMPRYRGLKITWPDSNKPIMIEPGHIYVDGMAAEMVGDGLVALNAQPDFPFDDALPDFSDDHFVYADVWERTVTAIEDKQLLDPALHGADTCTRTQAMAQIKWCSGYPDKALPTKGNSRLAVRLREEATVDDPCDPCAAEAEVDSNVGNYLFRVEVHDVQYVGAVPESGVNGKPEDGIEKITLKWSSENGAEQYLRTDGEPNEALPQAFTEGNWVFEFFNEKTEKHLGIHLSGGVVPARGELRTGYTATPPIDDYRFVRRWDGYCTLTWDSGNQEWLVSEAWSRGTDLYPAEAAARRIEDITGGKRFTLNDLLLELQLYTVVTGITVTDNNLSGTPLEINETPVTVADDSAQAKASAINDSVTDVDASAITVAKGVPVESTGEIADGDLTINGTSLGAVSAADNKQAQADAVVAAINAAFNSGAVKAEKTIEGAIVLTATDGRNINVYVADAAVSNLCGFAAGTTPFRGVITLLSQANKNIKIEGAHPEYAGFKSGIIPAVQFVAGDFWQAEVRDSVFSNELEKLRNAQAINAFYEIPPILQLNVPNGIEHHYFKLGVIEGGVLKDNQENDRKYAFPPLTEMTRMFHVAGDGQEAMPGDQVPQSLMVGVANGEWPVAGAKVAFYVNHGSGILVDAAEHPIPGISSTIADDETTPNIDGLIITTDDNGIARCDWELGPLADGEQQVIAWLVDPERDTPSSSGEFLQHPPIRFYANLSTADHVAYEPFCKPGTNTVHKLLVDDADTPPNSPDLPALDGYYTVKDVLDALLCKLTARHVPYDPVPQNGRWGDINDDASRPTNVQQAIDDLAENLESSDIRYVLPDCEEKEYGAPTVKSYLVDDIPPERKEVDGTKITTKVEDLWNAILCHLDAARVPYNPTIEEDRWRDIIDSSEVGENLWSHNYQGTSSDRGTSIAVDGAGNVLLTGYFSGELDFGDNRMEAKGPTDLFIAKFKAGGDHIWSHNYQGTSDEYGTSIAVDGAGNVLLTGNFSGELDFGGNRMEAKGPTDLFIAKFKANGDHIWSHNYQGTNDEYGTSIAVDGAGNVLLTGYFSGELDFGDNRMEAKGPTDLFIAKFKANGDHIWSHNYQETSSDRGTSIAVDGAGNVLMTGYFSGELDFGDNRMEAKGPTDLFIAKFKAGGDHIWSHNYQGTSDEYGTSIAVDGAGNVLLTGNFSGELDFGGNRMEAKGPTDLFIAKFKANGDHIWSHNYQGTNDEYGTSIAVDGAGNVLLTGYFFGELDFGGNRMEAKGPTDLFIANFNAGGDHIWSHNYQGTSFDRGTSIAADSAGNMLLTGHFYGELDFGGNRMEADGMDLFIVKLKGEQTLPITVQAAIDTLAEDLESSDMNYKIPSCSGTLDSVRERLPSLNGLVNGEELKVSTLFDALLCELDASIIPYDSGETTGSVADAIASIGSGKWSDGAGGNIYYDGGNVGIGTTDPKVDLHILDDSHAGIDLENTRNSYWRMVSANTGNLHFHQMGPGGGAAIASNVLNLVHTTGSVGIGTDRTGDDKLDVRGRCYSSGGWHMTNADYAEYFESSIKSSIPSGTSVVLEQDGNIRPCNDGEVPIGIVSSNAAIVGNSYKEWPSKYLRDEYGNLITEEYQEEIMVPKKKRIKKERQKVEMKKIEGEVVRIEVIYEKKKYLQKEVTETVTREEEMPVFKEVNLYDAEGKNKIGKHKVPVMETYEEEVDVLDDDGKPILAGTGKFETKERPKLNPEYDDSKEYVPREKRPEWNCVGLLGQLPLRKGRPVAPSWIKIKDISDEVELWLVK